MTKKVDRVTAKFGGRENLVFRIDRELLPAFELIIKEPAQYRLHRLVTGAATIKDIREVLEYSAPEGLGRKIPKPDNNAWISDFVEMRFQLERVRSVPPSFVTETLKDKPPLKYAVLAQGVLAAALLGIPEDAATFNEDEEVDDAA